MKPDTVLRVLVGLTATGLLFLGTIGLLAAHAQGRWPECLVYAAFVGVAAVCLFTAIHSDE